MKTCNIILFVVLALSFIGCNKDNNFIEEVKDDNQVVGFTGITTRAGGQPTADIYGVPHSNRNLLYVPDTVGVFVRKRDIDDYPSPSPLSDPLLENALYRITNYESTNFVEYNLSSDPLKQFPLTNGNGEVIVDKDPATPAANQEALMWYRTSHPAAYWDPDADIEYDIYAYAPRVETGTVNSYYNVSVNGEVDFEIDKKVGITADFIYAKAEEKTRAADAESLHLPFKHKLSKLVFKLKNSTENAITFYGLKYTIEYPIATFNLLTDMWQYSSTKSRTVISRYVQQEIFEDNEITLPEITTLLFPTDNVSNIVGGVSPTGVFFSLEICLNNKWYDVSSLINTAITSTDPTKKLLFLEGRLNEVTFNCNLNYGTANTWNIFVATFDSFEYGGTIGGTLK